jgi:1,4-dihydroxy-2-naphthoyl-CoA hydrolase
MFSYQHRVQLHQTDAYSIIFFANQLQFCHDAFQDFLLHIGFPLAPRRQVVPWMLVIVHAESDYLHPLQVGDLLTIHVRVKKIGTTSLIMHYDLVNQDGILVGKAQTVHVCIDTKTSRKKPLSAALIKALSAHKGRR